MIILTLCKRLINATMACVLLADVLLTILILFVFFYHLMLHGKAHAAVWWATECAIGHIILPSMVVDAADHLVTVIDVLHQKHPAPLAPAPAALMFCDSLPQFEDVEVTRSHVLFVAHYVQGGVALVDVMPLTGRMPFCTMAHTVPAFVMLVRRLLNSMLLAVDAWMMSTIGLTVFIKRALILVIC